MRSELESATQGREASENVKRLQKLLDENQELLHLHRESQKQHLLARLRNVTLEHDTALKSAVYV